MRGHWVLSFQNPRVRAIEANFDGLVGPSHNYAGLSHGNVASARNQGTVARPREAALQGIRKMDLLRSLGLVQGVIPPQERPNVELLRRLGFQGATDGEVIESTWREDPRLLAASVSASSMWVANAATVAPSADCADGKVHFTPANLSAKLHRTIEAESTAALLRAIFPASCHFVHHAPLPAGDTLGDEGAANHTCLCAEHGEPGLHVFSWGREALRADDRSGPSRFPARQTLEASRAVARLHRLDPARTHFVRQTPEVIDAGVFHNDVIAVGSRNVLLLHARAWVDQARVLDDLKRQLPQLQTIVVTEEDVPVADAVRSYLFNSQLVALPDGSMALVAPSECGDAPSVKAWLDRLPALGTPLRSVHLMNLRESMKNGGGPACLRLRVVLTGAELSAVHPGCLLTDGLRDRLVAWVDRRYREQIAPDEIRDPALLDECRVALDELTSILGIGSVYRFQQI